MLLGPDHSCHTASTQEARDRNFAPSVSFAFPLLALPKMWLYWSWLYIFLPKFVLWDLCYFTKNIQTLWCHVIEIPKFVLHILDEKIATKFCPWHDNCAVVPWAKFCSNMMARIWIIMNHYSRQTWIVSAKLLVKWDSGFYNVRISSGF